MKEVTCWGRLLGSSGLSRRLEGRELGRQVRMEQLEDRFRTAQVAQAVFAQALESRQKAAGYRG